MRKAPFFAKQTRYALVALLLLPMLSLTQGYSYASGANPQSTTTKTAKPLVATSELNGDFVNIQKAAQAYSHNTMTTHFATTPAAYQKIVDNGRTILADFSKSLKIYQFYLKVHWLTLPVKDSAIYPAKDTLLTYGQGLASYAAAQVLDLNMVQLCIDSKTPIPACLKLHYKQTVAPEAAALKQLSAPAKFLSAWAKKYNRTSVG